MRYADLTESVNYQIAVVPPSQLTPEQLNQIVNLVNIGGEVSSAGIVAGIQRAILVGFATVENQIVSIIAVKRPLPEYKQKVFSSAGVPDLAGDFDGELGYMYTSEEYRNAGITIPLARKLLSSYSGKLFITTRSNNTVVLLLARRVGFTPTGTEYQGRINKIILLTK